MSWGGLCVVGPFALSCYCLRCAISARNAANSARSASISFACSRVRLSSACTARRFTQSISVVVMGLADRFGGAPV